MMILVDTSVWIEFFKGKEPVFSSLKEHVEKNDVCAAGFIFGELLQGALNKKERTLISEYWHFLPKLDETDIFIEAGNYSSLNKLTSKGVGLVDAAIIQLARKNELQVWTLDKKLCSVLSSREIYKI